MHTSPQKLDCVIIGAGPAGLSAAMELAAMQHAVRIFDTGAVPPASGSDRARLLSRLQAEAIHHGVRISSSVVHRIEKIVGGDFFCFSGDEAIRARTVLLALDCADAQPLPAGFRLAIRRGAIRQCPLCDGSVAAGKRVAVVGNDTRSVGEALYLNHFASSIALLTLGRPLRFADHDRAALREAGIPTLQDAIVRVDVAKGGNASLHLRNGAIRRYDALYAIPGDDTGIDLVRCLGPEFDDEGLLEVNGEGRTSIAGLYATGAAACAPKPAAVTAKAIHCSL
ncbi:MAG TPA: NAD(P)/FAD-dependent oxidoreductase [Noviherbaspirillum sp.]|jgi:thioredoxin reductase (NADPH)|uniref:NAD(P)/FAD-dependent oxidoreductase n=1 Tax=Noviherbaspirillum sp. TaxID=1926288 RepID=UPI002DDD106F|nr:NAD(P)/FAD-dependent oxidoreductase [Noviherbaspirillum sp.]HEV2609078.1 NAD(P)/FAD-dependent oxidoreductase [Noviherbaspirillum sp.]